MESREMKHLNHKTLRFYPQDSKTLNGCIHLHSIIIYYKISGKTIFSALFASFLKIYFVLNLKDSKFRSFRITGEK